MTSNNRQLLSFAITLLLCAMLSAKGGLEFKHLKLCGPSNPKNTEIKISPWPIIPYGTPFNVTIAIIPAQDIFSVTARYVFMSEPDGRILSRGNDDLCRQRIEKICSLPANEKSVWKYSYKMRALPPGLDMTVRAEAKLYNGEDMEFCCVEAVAKIY